MRVPRFQPRNPEIRLGAYQKGARCDHTSLAGAMRGARMIEEAWRKSGHTVTVPVHEVPYGAGKIWAPDLSAFIGGLPPKP